VKNAIITVTDEYRNLSASYLVPSHGVWTFESYLASLRNNVFKR